MAKINAIHVGLGRWGLNWAREIFPASESIRVVRYVDADPSALRRLQTELSVPAACRHSSLREALAASDCDAVIVCLPLESHAATIAEALGAGKHVLTEKPFTSTLREAARLISLAESRGLTLMASQNYRFYPAAIAASDLVRSGKLGALRYVKVDFRRDTQRDGHGWPGLADPLLVDMAIHHFDLMRMIIAAEPDSLSCSAWNLAGSPFADPPAAALTLRFPGGIIVSYRGAWLDLAPSTAWAGEWQMDFERGAAFWTSRGGNRANLTDQDRLAIQKIRGALKPQKLRSTAPPGRAGVLAAFAKAIKGQAKSSYPLARDNIRTLAICHAALRSAAAGGAEVRVADLLQEAGA